MQRALAVLLVSSVVPLAFVWPSPELQRTAAESHADWLRAQVRTPLEGDEHTAFEAALEAAEKASTPSLSVFLQRFVAAYAQQQEGGASLAALLGLSSESPQHIINELQRRLAHVSGWATTPRLTTTLHAATVSSSVRHATGAAPFVAPRMVPHLHVVGLRPLIEGVQHTPVWALSQARPRGP